jgi:tetratricopeptide (TPR) repeat protein
MEDLLEIAEDGIITGDLVKSLEILNKVIEDSPSERAYYLRGYLYYCLRDFEKAIPELKFVTENYPGNDEAFYYLSQIFSLNGDTDKAKEYIEKALECDPENIDYLGDVISIEQALRNYDRCIELCDILIDETPGSNFALNARGFAYMQKGMLDKAIADFKKNIKENPIDFVGWTNLGIAYLKTGQLQEAKKALQDALRINQIFADAYGNMGYVFFRENDINKAFLYLNRAIELDPQNADAYKKRAELYISKGEKTEARNDLLKAEELGYSKFYDDEAKELLNKLE